MNNIIILLSVLLLINQKVQCNCICGYGKIFNGDTETCTPIPQSSDDEGYIENCIEYSFKVKGLECEKCQLGYSREFDQTMCEGIGIENCLEFMEGLNGNECFICKQGLYVSQDGSQCIQNPTNGQQGYIQDCMEYQFDSISLECVQCIEGKYIDGEQVCIDNPSSRNNGYVQNCQKYIYVDGALKCRMCEDGYLLKNSLCVTMTSTNCLKISESGVCSQCEEGYYDHDIEICKENPKEGEKGYVKDCREYYYEDDEFECNYCKAGYYFNENSGNCQKGEDYVKYCSELFRSSQNNGYSCTGCTQGYYLGSSISEVCSLCGEGNQKQQSSWQRLQQIFGGMSLMVILLVFI